MARSKRDSPVVVGSGDPVEDEEEMVAVATEVDEEEKGEEGEEEEEEADEAPAEDSVQAAAAEQGSPPVLAEGYYEIETIRRRRLRKGQLQYLVKWRGWPESANTWEPFENLKACSDFVDAFEKRQQNGKRKRKAMTTPVIGPNPSQGKRGRPRRSDPRSLPRTPAPVPKRLPLRTSSRRATNNSNKNSVGGHDASVSVVGQQMLRQNVTRESNSNILSVGSASQRAPLSVVVDQQDEPLVVNHDLSKVENSVQAPPSQAGQVTGAKKRKSGSVRRFKQDEATREQGELHNGKREKPGNEDVDSTEGETGDRNKGEDCANRIHITKIIKPVRYFATMTNDVQQVSITFKALRSDGQEVLVDDKELKANNPLVLINYYEQHLRYNPTS